MKLAAFLFKKFKYYMNHYFDPQEDGGYTYRQVKTFVGLVVCAVLLFILVIYIIKEIISPG